MKVPSPNPRTALSPGGFGSLVLLCAFLSGCANIARVENVPLEHAVAGTGYGATLEPGHSKFRVALAFSGGGTRAAALSYGVLKELRNTEVEVDGERVRLLDLVTYISSVSGGSFASAYYGLYGDRIFEDFEERFLRKDIDHKLAVDLLSPVDLFRLTFTPYTRSDMAMDLYDEEVFGGATFADLEKADGPLLNINATDIDVGTVFTFVQPHFDLICSDLSKLRVSQAVTASSAVPGVFSPLRLQNHAGSCDLLEPEWISEAMADPAKARRRYHDARNAATYLDTEERPNIFLVDGGVSDNIGARRMLAEIYQAGGVMALVEEQALELPEQLLYIVVNSQAEAQHEWVKGASVPSAIEVLSAVSSVGIYRYNFDTVELLRESAASWSREASDHGVPMEARVAEVAFDHVADPEERAFLNDVATSFTLPDETIDRLIEVGGRLLRESSEYQAFLASFGGAVSAPDGP